jgi:magnesium-transporting ATPase (P-type)
MVSCFVLGGLKMLDQKSRPEQDPIEEIEKLDKRIDELNDKNDMTIDKKELRRKKQNNKRKYKNNGIIHLLKNFLGSILDFVILLIILAIINHLHNKYLSNIYFFDIKYLFAALAIIYFSLFEGLLGGSIGKKIIGLKVVKIKNDR